MRRVKAKNAYVTSRYACWVPLGRSGRGDDRVRPSPTSEDVPSHDRAGSTVHLPSLTGLRFLAALLVFGNHAGDAFLDPDSRINAVLQTGWVGVSFFFILSGFVLTWSHRPGDRPLAFYRRRAARIMPNHVVAWVIALVLFTVVIGESVDLLGAVASLVLMQAWHPSAEVHFVPVHAVAWTLSVEALFYATFPYVRPLLARLTNRHRRTAIAGTIFAVATVAALGYALSPHERHWIIYVFPLARLPEFLLGILLALELRDRRRSPVTPGVMFAAAMAAWVACQAAPPPFQVAFVTLVPFAGLIMAAAAADVTGRRSSFRHTAMVRLGEWSFAFYLLHTVVLTAADHAIELSDRGPAFIAVGVPITLALSIAASAALFTFWERPLERRLRGPGRERRHPVPSALAP